MQIHDLDNYACASTHNWVLCKFLATLGTLVFIALLCCTKKECIHRTSALCNLIAKLIICTSRSMHELPFGFL